MSIRRPIVAANWKMNMGPSETEGFVSAFVSQFGVKCASDVVLVPPFTSIPKASESLNDHPVVALGAQNMHPQTSGAYTGEVSSVFLKELLCKYVVLGHSERREYFAETDAFINEKVLSCLEANLRPILCIGESLEQRDAGQLEEVCRTQLEGGLANVGENKIAEIVIAYEPIWAIGTGRTASPEQAQEAHAFIRSVIADLYDQAAADRVRIQYGGSMKPNNAAELMSQPDVDGGLVGGASLEAGSFKAIVQAAVESVEGSD